MLTYTTLPSNDRVSPPLRRRIKNVMGIVDGILFYSVLVFGMFLLSPGFLLFGLAWTLILQGIFWGIKWGWIIIRSIS